jgi:hypothetical protein
MKPWIRVTADRQGRDLQLTETIPHIVGLQGEGMILLAAQVAMRKIPRDKEGG